jgi:hypothetical protein
LLIAKGAVIGFVIGFDGSLLLKLVVVNFHHIEKHAGYEKRTSLSLGQALAQLRD